MCGIVGYIGNENALEKLHIGLKNLEYRGYDSAGVSFFYEKKLKTIKNVGKVDELFEKINRQQLRKKITIGIGHTRWATHGKPSLENCHPHSSRLGKVVLVHNGIIENFLEIKNEYLKNITFESETDTEVAANLIEQEYILCGNKLEAIKKTMQIIQGSYAFAIMFFDDPQNVYFSKQTSPLLLGISKFGNSVASDVLGFGRETNEYIDLKDGQFGWISKEKFEVFEKDGTKTSPLLHSMPQLQMDVELEQFKHYMLKEIFEVPKTIENTAKLYLSKHSPIKSKKLEKIIKQTKRVHLIACGTSYHACKVGEIWLKKLGIDATSEIASEFIYSPQKLCKKALCVFVSQSGETADTLTAIKLAKKQHVKTIGITNVETSSITKLCDIILPTKCGPEIAVASTKAYNGQLCTLKILAEKIKVVQNQEKLKAKIKNISATKISKITTNSSIIAKNMQKNIKKIEFFAQKIKVAKLYKQIKPLTKSVLSSQKVFMVGKNFDYVLAKEAALKLKEISYIQAEAYPSGELKHGTISLVDDNTIVFAFVTEKKLAEKTMNIVHQTKSRGAKLIVVTPFMELAKDKCIDNIIMLPKLAEDFYPMLAIVPMQLLAYDVSTALGNDPDKPRNLAKSVTVE